MASKTSQGMVRRRWLAAESLIFLPVSAWRWVAKVPCGWLTWYTNPINNSGPLICARPRGKGPCSARMACKPLTLSSRSKSATNAFASATLPVAPPFASSSTSYHHSLHGNPYQAYAATDGDDSYKNHPKGSIIGADAPSSVVLEPPYAQQQQYQGYSFTEDTSFASFARLQIGTKWYRISKHLNWHHTMIMIFQNTNWDAQYSSTGPSPDTN